MEDPSTISNYIGLTKRKDKLYYAKYSRSEIPFSGKKTHYYPNGKLSFRGSYKDGKPDGIHEFYQSTGGVQKISYKYGEISSIEYYYKNGRLSGIIPYKHGLRDGISKGYKDDGLLVSQVTYKNGLRHGWSSWCSWGLSTKLWNHAFYENGEIMGFDHDDPYGPKNEKEIEESATQLSLFT